MNREGWRLIPGVRQDHLGRSYQEAVGPNGAQEMVFVNIPAPSKEIQDAMEPVEVTSIEAEENERSSYCSWSYLHEHSILPKEQ